jgi:hypothetical protein
MISIVGFGRPKFGGAKKTESKPSSKPSTSQKIPAKVGPEVKAAIDLLTKNGYTVSK